MHSLERRGSTGQTQREATGYPGTVSDSRHGTSAKGVTGGSDTPLRLIEEAGPETRVSG